MTKVQTTYDLTSPIDETLMRRIAGAHGYLGLQRLQLAPSLDHVLVEYDAARLTLPEVDAVLHRLGIPARRRG